MLIFMTTRFAKTLLRRNVSSIAHDRGWKVGHVVRTLLIQGTIRTILRKSRLVTDLSFVTT